MKSSLAIAALGVLLSTQAAANEYSVLMKTHKYAEVERVANAKLAQDAGNADALVAKSEAVLGGRDVSRKRSSLANSA